MRDLELLIRKVPRGVHGLSLSDLDSSDKMNATKGIKLCQERVERALKTLSRRDTEATRLYLRIMRYVYESFSKSDLSESDRLSMAWNATFILRGWKQNNTANEFVSDNVYQCQEVNCHNLTAIVRSLRDKDKVDTFVPNKMQSQTCEQMFRRLRSFTTTEMTITNLDTKDALSRLHRIALIEDSELFLQENGFIFPRANQQSIGNETIKHEKLPDDSKIEKIVHESKEKALNHLKHFGVNILDKNLSCQVNFVPHFEDLEDESDNEMENVNLDEECEESNDCDDELIRKCEGIALSSNDSTVTSMYNVYIVCIVV